MDDEIGADERLRLEQLALDMPTLPDFAAAESDLDIKTVVDQFFGGTLVSGPAGGVVEEVRVEALDDLPDREPSPETCPTEEVMP